MLKFLPIFLSLFCVLAHGSDFHDFCYKADIILKKDQSIFETLADIISESQIMLESKTLRVFSQQDKTVSNMRALKERITQAVEAIHKKAHMQGFYGAEIHHTIRKSNPVEVKIYVNLGNKFNLKLDASYVGQSDDFCRKHMEILHSDLRRFKASIEEIKALIEIAVRNMKQNGFFEPKILEQRVSVDYEKHEATLHLMIDPGAKVFFSDVRIKSFPNIKDCFVKNRIAWSEGEVFDISKVEETTDCLMNSQIFSKVKIKPDEDAILGDRVPMLIELEEEKRHTIEIGVLYSGMHDMNFKKESQTQKKLKSIITRFGWTNNNVYGGGEKIRLMVEGTPMRVSDKRSDYAFEAALSQPDIFLRNNTAEYCVSRRQELTNVFFKRSDQVSVRFSYPLPNSLLLKIGGCLEANSIDASEVFFRGKNSDKKYENFSIPVEIILDKTNDLLNPTSGYRVEGKFSEIFFKHSTIGILKTLNLLFSYNYALDDLKRTILAFKARKKSVFGQKIDLIPIDKRIYTGGINSVRGFSHQMATEIVAGEETPMGGKSSLEYSAEIRRRFSESFGGVIFFDGSKIFQNSSIHMDLQTEKKRWFYAVGIGIRYFTSIGPIRADFAIPIRRRRGIDSKLQFIMSLGQAF
ncbi:MAG: BamA/TamA family outer membrane protein [Holosporaceae bacterium]|nr:BamA/TamA family outer membrane protein [Holosporaceae bacterium]